MIGHSIDDAVALAAKAKGVNVDDLLKYLSGSTTMKQTIPMVGQNLNFLTAGKFSKPIGRFAGSAVGRYRLCNSWYLCSCECFRCRRCCCWRR